MKIVHKIEKPLLQRTEVTVEVAEGKITPSNAELAKHIASKMGCGEDTVVMKHIRTAFGSTKSEAVAYVYKDAKAKAMFEPKTKHVREAEKKAAEAKAAEAKAAAEAKPAEPKAESPKAEGVKA